MPIFSKVDPAKPAVTVERTTKASPILPQVTTVSEPAPVFVTKPAAPSPQKSNDPQLFDTGVKKVSGRQAIATTSIFGLLNGDTAEETSTSATQSILGQKSVILKESFTAESLVSVWKQFVEQVDAPQLKSALGSREPVLKENWRIEYSLDNDLQLQRITMDLKPKLIGFLHRNLKNELIEIDFNVVVSTEEIAHRPYTDTEKWNVLAEKYPALSVLKTKFNLDFEHF